VTRVSWSVEEKINAEFTEARRERRIGRRTPAEARATESLELLIARQYFSLAELERGENGPRCARVADPFVSQGELKFGHYTERAGWKPALPS
jgi:hypothetical protein